MIPSKGRPLKLHGTHRDWTEHQVIVNGVRLYYRAAGDPSAAPVVLLHGFPETGYSWRHQLLALAGAGYYAVAPDLRGYGRSEKPAGTAAYRVETVAADIAGLIDILHGPPAAAVVGHDWGGGVAWALGVLHPESTRRIALLNCPPPEALAQAIRPRARRHWRFPVQLLRSWYILFFQVPLIPEIVLRRGGLRFVDAVFRPAAARNPQGVTPVDVAHVRHEMARPGALTAAINYYRAMLRRWPDEAQDLRRRLRRIDVPSLVIWGERDPYLGVELLEGLERWAPGAKVIRLPQSGHFCHQEAPERINQALIGWLDEGE
jgi:epoxide hydrolase 4